MVAWKNNILACKEKCIREKQILPNTENIEEVRWANEGSIPNKQLESVLMALNYNSGMCNIFVGDMKKARKRVRHFKLQLWEGPGVIVKKYELIEKIQSFSTQKLTFDRIDEEKFLVRPKIGGTLLKRA